MAVGTTRNQRVKLTRPIPDLPVKRVLLKRPPVVYDWKGVFEGWTRKFVHENHWRVARVLGDQEDAMQHCALLFYTCVDRYGGTVNDPKWMMALYQQTVRNSFHTLAVNDVHARTLPEEFIDLEESEGDLSEFVSGFAALSSDARSVVSAVFTAPQEFLELLLPDTATDDTRERIFRRLLRLSKGAVGVVAELRAFLKSPAKEPPCP